MQAIAAQLSAEGIANTAAYFASLPGAAAGAKSPQLPNLAKTGVTFPELTSHEGAGETSRYAKGASLRVLAEAVSRLGYGFDTGHLVEG
jgi:hypothetical protein